MMNHVNDACKPRWATKALCATDCMLINNRFAWFSACSDMWIWKHFICWCACHSDCMLLVHVWTGVNASIPCEGSTYLHGRAGMHVFVCYWLRHRPRSCERSVDCMWWGESVSGKDEQEVIVCLFLHVWTVSLMTSLSSHLFLNVADVSNNVIKKNVKIRKKNSLFALDITFWRHFGGKFRLRAGIDSTEEAGELKWEYCWCFVWFMVPPTDQTKKPKKKGFIEFPKFSQGCLSAFVCGREEQIQKMLLCVD